MLFLINFVFHLVVSVFHFCESLGVICSLAIDSPLLQERKVVPTLLPSQYCLLIHFASAIGRIVVVDIKVQIAWYLLTFVSLDFGCCSSDKTLELCLRHD